MMSVNCRKFSRGPRDIGALFIADKTLDAGLESMSIDDLTHKQWASLRPIHLHPERIQFLISRKSER